MNNVICSNGHPVEDGNVFCTECGARIVVVTAAVPAVPPAPVTAPVAVSPPISEVPPPAKVVESVQAAPAPSAPEVSRETSGAKKPLIPIAIALAASLVVGAGVGAYAHFGPGFALPAVAQKLPFLHRETTAEPEDSETTAEPLAETSAAPADVTEDNDPALAITDEVESEPDFQVEPEPEPTETVYVQVMPAPTETVYIQTQPAPTQTVYVQPQIGSGYGDAVCSPVGYTNVRSGPGADYAVLRKISSGGGVTVIDSQNGWVKLAGGGWVNSNQLLSNQNILNETVTLRVSPSSNSAYMSDTLSAGTCVYVKGIQGSWAHVLDGWLPTWALSGNTINSGNAGYSVSTARVTSPLNMRTAPSCNASVIQLLSKGSNVVPTGEVESGWYRVSYAGRTGWVSGKYIGMHNHTLCGSS